MVLECVPCGEFHDLTQADMILIITAYQNGELSVIGGKPLQILPQCMLKAFTDDNVKAIQKKYPKRQLSFIPAAA